LPVFPWGQDNNGEILIEVALLNVLVESLESSLIMSAIYHDNVTGDWSAVQGNNGTSLTMNSIPWHKFSEGAELFNTNSNVGDLPAEHYDGGRCEYPNEAQTDQHEYDYLSFLRARLTLFIYNEARVRNNSMVIGRHIGVVALEWCYLWVSDIGMYQYRLRVYCGAN